MCKLTRRDFAKTATAAGVATALSAGRVRGANERVRLGFIGLGNRGDQVLDAFLAHKDAEVVAVCDLYAPYLDFAARKIGTSPQHFRDYRQLLDRKRVVRPRESIEWTRRLVTECGVFAGLSAGAALAGAAKVAASIDRGTIVFVVSDGGWKYLSTGAYTADLDAAEAAAERVIYF